MILMIFVSLISFFVPNGLARKPISSSRLELLTGVKADSNKKTKWDERYSRRSFVYGKSPAKFLSENYQYIPYGSSVLDMGMGEGRNAVFLAQKGYEVTGIDISSVAVKKARLLAKEFDVKFQTIVASLDKHKIPEQSYDAIICFYFVERDLVKKMKKWLRPGGILIFEAHTTKQRQYPEFKDEPKSYFLKPQELLTLFPGMKVLKYEEPNHEREYRASIILQKKKD